MNLGAVLPFLAALGCSPSSPTVVVDPAMPTLGYFEGGVVRVRSGADSGVLVHELVHACQYEKDGPARSTEEQHQRERDARRIELQWRQQDE